MKRRKKIQTRKEYILKLSFSFLIIFITGSLLLMICSYYYVPRFIFDGEYLTVEVNSKVEDNKSIARYKGKIVSYKIKEQIDTSSPGESIITYVIKSGSNTFEEKRKVLIVDSVVPKINLIGGLEISVPYNKEFVDPGYTAKDNYDGDISDKMTIESNVNTNKLGYYTVIYTVKDSSDNTSQAIRLVKVVDKEKPVIELTDYKRFLIVGKDFSFPKVTAYDNYDGDLTKMVSETGDVNSSKAGVYDLTYKVSDTAGNETIMIASINVQNANTKGVPVLLYHEFYDSNKSKSSSDVSVSMFKKQMNYLMENNYYFLTINELDEYINKGLEIPQKSILLTIDHASQSFYSLVANYLEEKKIPSTVFAITSDKLWENNKDKYKYITYQSHSDSMHKKGCGSSISVAMCSSYNAVYNDIKTSIQKIDSSIAFSYPYGNNNSTYIKAVKDNDIHIAFTETNGIVKTSTNRYKLPRIKIFNNTTLKQFINKIK